MQTLQRSVILTPEEIEGYLAYLRERGRTEGTLRTYRRSLQLLYRALPEDKEIQPDTLLCWQGELVAAGYSPSTVNMCLSVANNFLSHQGLQPFRTPEQLAARDEARPELTRREYLRLLQTARLLGKERLYLLIKLFATTGLTVQELHNVTVEAVREGRVTVYPGGVKTLLRFPPCVQEELAGYASRQGVASGPVFVTRTGGLLNRTNVADSIRRLCRDAQVDERKGNPRCLRRLYQETQKGIRDNLALLMEQAYDRMLEEEQLYAGWEQEG